MQAYKEILEAGGALILPTETVYGLFARAMDQRAVDHIYQLKGRPRDKAMNLNVASLEDIYQFSKDQPPYLETLYQQFLPGPLTIILKANDRVPHWINSGLETVGFRLPCHPLTLDLIRQVGPLVGPSANLSGQASGTRFEEVAAQFQGQVAGYADDQALTGQDSTILDLSDQGAKILRQGAIRAKDIKATIPEIQFID